MIQFWSLRENDGPVSYARAHALQLALVDLRARERIPDTVLFLEHPPVITRGRGLQFDPKADPSRPKRMPIVGAIPNGVEVHDIERGGDLTFHEPGQLVIYPICKLGDPAGFSPERDISRFLRRFENAAIAALGEFGVKAHARENATGVWIERTPPGKLASMGIAVRKWVTYHGLAINGVNAMAGFRLISPCGFSPDTMARLQDFAELGSDWRERLERAIALEMSEGRPLVEITRLDLAKAAQHVAVLEPQSCGSGAGVLI